MVKQKTKTSRKTLNIFWQHSKKYKLLISAFMVLIPLNTLFESIVIPLYTARALDKLAAGGAVLSDFYGIFAVILAANIFTMIGWRVTVASIWTFESRVMRDLYEKSFNYLMGQSHRFFVNRFAGSLVSQVNKFVGAYERLADTIVWNIYTLASMYLFTMIVLWGKVPAIVGMLVLVTVVYLTVIITLKRKELPLNEAMAQSETAQTGQLADSITNIAAVKSYSNEDKEKKLYKLKLKDVIDANVNLMRVSLRHDIWTSGLGKIFGILALVGAIVAVVEFKQPIGIVYLVTTYVGNILGRLWDIQYSFRTINRAFGDASPMTKMLTDIPHEVTDDSQAPELKVPSGAVHFENVDFGYPEQQASSLFSKFTLDVKPGEKIGLVGPSGGGKTTVTMLLLRFMDIQGGRILIDDQDISLVKQQSLRHAIAYVPQEPMMFHRSIADNIRYGRLGATDDDVVKAAKQANAHEFIEKLPEGYKTLVGERGTKLSGGQRQRVAIARAILSDAPILVLDEATSALDSESEKLIQDALKKLMKGRTTLVVAHRLSTIQTMDRIVVLEEGHITEQGSHKELLDKQGHYANLWNHQSGGFLED